MEYVLKTANEIGLHLPSAEISFIRLIAMIPLCPSDHQLYGDKVTIGLIEGRCPMDILKDNKDKRRSFFQ